MEVTERMLQVAVKKAVELKVIPAWGSMDDYLKNWQNIREILNVAINTASQQSKVAKENEACGYDGGVCEYKDGVCIKCRGTRC